MSSTMAPAGVMGQDRSSGLLHRELTWKDAFWVASGAPAFVLFPIGAIAATVGKPAWAIWIVSITIGFLQSFTYAEISGLFPHKSGGASVYGAIAWLRYSKVLAPISVWSNWFAWSPVLALGTALAANYVLTVLFRADSAILTWQITLANLDFIKSGLTLRVNATFLLGAALLLLTFSIQHRGPALAARLQKYVGWVALFPLLVLGILPLVNGTASFGNWAPLVPLARDAAGQPIDGSWNAVGWTLMIGGLFVAGWSTYGFETAACYTREFRNPKSDTFKAIFYSGLLCLVVYTLVPLSFQGALGMQGLLQPGIYDGSGVAAAMAHIVGGGLAAFYVMVILLVFSLLLSVMTSMMGTSRTLYQASVDGWLPRYLSQVNEHGAPTNAMWTDLTFNLVLLTLSDNVAVLAMSNVCYFLFVFLNLQAGWIHRLDRPAWSRPFRCPNWLLAAGAVCGFLNLACIGAGADVWGPNTMRNGLIAAFLIVPVFLYRHYVTDKGVFPAAMRADMQWRDDHAVKAGAGWLPYACLVAAAATIWISHSLAVF